MKHTIQEEQFAETWRLKGKARILRAVIGAVHFEPRNGQARDCRVSEERRVDDVIIGVVEVGENARRAPTFSGSHP